MTNHSRSPNTLDTFKAILIPMCSQNTDSISSLKSGCRCPVEGAPNDSLPSHRKKWGTQIYFEQRRPGGLFRGRLRYFVAFAEEQHFGASNRAHCHLHGAKGLPDFSQRRRIPSVRSDTKGRHRSPVSIERARQVHKPASRNMAEWSGSPPLIELSAGSVRRGQRLNLAQAICVCLLDLGGFR